MTKRVNRLAPIEHEQRQIEALKRLTPNTTPEHYRALSDGLVDVSITLLDLIAALELNRRPDFEQFYNRLILTFRESKLSAKNCCTQFY